MAGAYQFVQEVHAEEWNHPLQSLAPRESQPLAGHSFEYERFKPVASPRKVGGVWLLEGSMSSNMIIFIVSSQWKVNTLKYFPLHTLCVG